MSEAFDRVYAQITAYAEAYVRETGSAFSFKEGMQRAYEAGRVAGRGEAQIAAGYDGGEQVQQLRSIRVGMQTMKEALAHGGYGGGGSHSHNVTDPGHSHGASAWQGRNAQQNSAIYNAGIADGKRRAQHEERMRAINQQQATIAKAVRETYDRLGAMTQTDSRLGYLWSRDE